jgi:cytochrome c556
MSTRTILMTTLMLSATALLVRADTLNDESFQKLMKEVGSATKRFKNEMVARDAAGLTKDATRIADIYKQMAPFWTARKAEDAAKWSQESSAAAMALAADAKKGDWAAVKTGTQGVFKNCKSCHDTYREKLPDGGYKIKGK